MSAAQAPECRTLYHGPMEPRPVERQSPEAAWCGTWYDCSSPRCGSSALDPSPELAAFLAAQAKP